MSNLTDASPTAERTIEELGPWFHNLHLPGDVQTAPDHGLGDFPRNKWRDIAPHLPDDLGGWKVLDVGCTNATGLFLEQCQRLEEAAAAPVERVYWYSLIDLDPHRDAIEGFHVDENEYHLGLVTSQLEPKPALETFRNLVQEPAATSRRA